MRRRAPILCLYVLAAFVPASLPAAGDDAPDPRACAERFGAALRAGEARLLQPMLPQRGKVKLRLVRLGAEQGSFSAGQVQAVFLDFFKKGSVDTFEVFAPEDAAESYALVRARAQVIDRNGTPAIVDLHLVIEVEDGRWVLREIGEAQR